MTYHSARPWENDHDHDRDHGRRAWDDLHAGDKENV